MFPYLDFVFSCLMVDLADHKCVSDLCLNVYLVEPILFRAFLDIYSQLAVYALGMECSMDAHVGGHTGG